jgi:hypothetical protein
MEFTSTTAPYQNQKSNNLEGILVPFIDEFTGKATDNKGIFDAQLQEKTKYKDVTMKQRHIDYPIFHIKDMTKADSCK